MGCAKQASRKGNILTATKIRWFVKRIPDNLLSISVLMQEPNSKFHKKMLTIKDMIFAKQLLGLNKSIYLSLSKNLQRKIKSYDCVSCDSFPIFFSIFTGRERKTLRKWHFLWGCVIHARGKKAVIVINCWQIPVYLK